MRTKKEVLILLHNIETREKLQQESLKELYIVKNWVIKAEKTIVTLKNTLKELEKEILL